MGKYKINKRASVLKGNKVTLYPASDEIVILDAAAAAELGDRVVAVGVPADTPDTQAAKASKSS